MGFPVAQQYRTRPPSRRFRLDPGSGRSPGEWDGSLPRYSGLGNPMEKGAQQATAYGVPKSETRQWLNNNNKF